MSKKRKWQEEEADLGVEDDDEDDYGGGGKAQKNSLDSDEEEESGSEGEEGKYDVVRGRNEGVEGEEEGLARMEGEVRVTPFNLREEMEEGHFDEDGHFVWRKEAQVRDGWLDQVDNMPLAHRQGEAHEDVSGSEEDEERTEAQKEGSVAAYKDMLGLMRPGETVAQALRRLGGSSSRSSTAQRWKAKRQQQEKGVQSGEGQEGQQQSDKEKMLQLTGLADGILTATGNMDVYQETYEAISFKVQEKGMESLDMFSEDFVQKEEEQKVVGPCGAGGASSEETTWELKRRAEEDCPVEGPHPTRQMLAWSQEGAFGEKGVLVRRTGTHGPFYSSRRVDFDLYL